MALCPYLCTIGLIVPHPYTYPKTHSELHGSTTREEALSVSLVELMCLCS